MATTNPAIREPNVDIFQRVAPTASATPRVGLAPFCCAVNYFWMRAQDSDGSWNSDALMGTYEDDDNTWTYALPNLESGATFDEDSLEVHMAVGTSDWELDGPSGESVVIASTAQSVVPNATEFDLTDTVQVFTGAGGSGVVADGDPADYVVRMEGTDGNTYDFTIATVAATVLTIRPTAGGMNPSNSELDYEVVLNPTKYIVNSAAIASSLRVNSETADLLVEGSTPGNADVTFTANATNFPGNDGNSITVNISHTGSESISVSGLAITITINTGTTTGTGLVALVDGSSEALFLVSAAVGSTPGDPCGTTTGAESLTGGSHIVFEAPTAGLAGDAKRVRYALAAGDPEALSLQLNGNDLTVILENLGGAEQSTDTEIATAITNDATVSAWITATAYGGTGVPEETVLDTYTNLAGGYDANSVTLDANLIGTTGITANVYVEYRALSKKWTSEASTATTSNEPQMVVASDSDTLESLVGELTDDNPLGLMMSLALQNNPGGTVYGLGVDAVSSTETDGTAAAWQRAVDFMKSENPYFYAIGSQRDAIHDKWIALVDYMNGDGVTEPAVMEMFLFINKEMPLTTPDELLSSGDDLTGTGPTYTASENFYLLGVQAGDVVVVGDGSTGYTTLQSGLKGYPLLAAAEGTPYTIEMDYTPPPANPSVSGEDWAVYRPGTALISGGTYLKDTIAETINQINGQIANRKVSSTFPDNVTLTVGGVQKNLAGYYADAAQVGQCAAQPVSQSKVRQTLGGIDSVRFSSDFFSNEQLDVIQGGGTWVRHVPVPGGAVQTRHALTTDITSPLTYNPTCAWQVDKYARLIRSAVRRTLGGTITLSLLDSLAMKMDQVGRHMVDSQELARADIDTIEQGDGTTTPIDNIIVVGEASPLQPNNGIQFYLTVASS